jgi:ABC-type sugar transport system ATPase subunit
MIRLESIGIRAGDFALQDVSLTVPSGAYGVLMGNTGCGKTTLLEIICGLRRPASGHVWLDGRDVTDLPPGERGVGYVPQDGALFPTLTAREQLGFALRIRRVPPEQIAGRVAELAAQLGIASLLDRLPDGLSGGEVQRVALGRALSARPRVLLLDEPLSALDDDRRDALAELLATVQRETKITVLHVTHHRAEAGRLAGVLLRLIDGRIAEAQPIAGRTSHSIP